MSPYSCTSLMLRRSSFSSCCSSVDTDVATSSPPILGVNVGVPAVAAAFATSSRLNAGLGLGLFGVLSIIRLRSEELAQHEIAYYFAALALGLIGGLSITPTALHLALMALIVVALWVGDHALVARPTSRQEVLLDCGFTDGATGVIAREGGARRRGMPDWRRASSSSTSCCWTPSLRWSEASWSPRWPPSWSCSSSASSSSGTWSSRARIGDRRRSRRWSRCRRRCGPASP